MSEPKNVSLVRKDRRVMAMLIIYLGLVAVVVLAPAFMMGWYRIPTIVIFDQIPPSMPMSMVMLYNSFIIINLLGVWVVTLLALEDWLREEGRV